LVKLINNNNNCSLHNQNSNSNNILINFKDNNIYKKGNKIINLSNKLNIFKDKIHRQAKVHSNTQNIRIINNNNNSNHLNNNNNNNNLKYILITKVRNKSLNINNKYL